MISTTTRRRLIISAALLAALATFLWLCWWQMIRMPGSSFDGDPLAAVETSSNRSTNDRDANEAPGDNSQTNHPTENKPLGASPDRLVSGDTAPQPTSREVQNSTEDPDRVLNPPDQLPPKTETTNQPEQPEQIPWKKTAQQLRQDVEHLAVTIGERNLRRYQSLCDAADFVEQRLGRTKLGVRRQSFQVQGLNCDNLILEKKGTELPEEIVLLGAHYDSAPGTPGANDNGSGTAALIWLARQLTQLDHKRTLRIVAFTNEEPPYFQTREMGSLVHAKECRRNGDNLTAVFSLETMGYYSDEPGSQKFPSRVLAAMYPSEGNFIGFIGNLASAELVKKSVKRFRANAKFPSEGAALPSVVTGIGWSDHWSFWQHDYQGLMVTDTALFRYPHYHKQTDLPDKIDFDRLALVVHGIEKVLVDFLNQSSQ